MAVFVVHEHNSSHLHWDLRLEMDGVLKSWAVPKEPPTRPGTKRLAVKVNDHSLEYDNFDGEIPKGYGAGTVSIWDRGEMEIISRKEEKMVFRLDGKKMKGEYVLLRFRKAGEKDWLFFKKSS